MSIRISCGFPVVRPEQDHFPGRPKGKTVTVDLHDVRSRQRPMLRPMISFMISVVPPKMDWIRASRYALAIGYSVM
jgi:hypothetical protein